MLEKNFLYAFHNNVMLIFWRTMMNFLNTKNETMYVLYDVLFNCGLIL
jgi:hypothetical protein